LPPKHLNPKFDTSRLITINDKPLYYHRWGSDASTGAPIVFMHGLGGTTDFFGPLIQTLNLRLTHKLHVFDFEGHGQSPTSPLRAISISSLAEDLNGIFEHADITSDATIIAHAMGCLIAVHFALSHPSKISRLILLGPPPSPLSKIESMIPRAHKQSTLENSLFKLANRSAAVGASEKIRSTNPLALTAMNLSLQAQDPEGYAKACRALADAEQLDFSAIQAKTLILVGSEDGLSTPKVCEEYATAMQGRARVEVLEDVGNWPIFEDCASVARAVDAFLKEE
jgi:pimeloyl-ACP methyl ester carboxylesterase